MKLSVYVSVIFITVILLFTLPVSGDLDTGTEDFSSENDRKQLSLSNLIRHPEYDVLSYQIAMTILPDSHEIEAVSTIGFEAVFQIADNLFFDFAGLSIDSVKLDTKAVPSFITDELLTIQLTQPLMAGDTHLVQIYYRGTPDKGLYFRHNSQNRLIVYTHNEPYDAHYWFPCKDDPSDKATLEMAITVPTPFTVISNGKLIATNDRGQEYTAYYWKEEYPIATYLISLAAGEYAVVEDSYHSDGINMPLAYYVYPSDFERGQMALTKTKLMLDFFSNYIGDYPFLQDKYAMVEVPFREASAMENQTATTMRDLKMDNENIIAHELAHQWWGDALTPASFSDIWLNEGFATYFDALFTEFKYGPGAYLIRMDEFHSQMNADGSLPYPIYNPPDEYLFGNAVYLKGAWVLHMLRAEVGDSLFKEISQYYFENYKYDNVTTSEFKQIVELLSHRDFSIFFDQWLNYGGRPFISGEWEQKKNILDITLKQIQGDPVYQFDLELLIKGVSTDTLLGISLTDAISFVQIMFSDPVSQIIIDPNKKILTSNNSPLYYIPRLTGLVNVYPNPFNNEVSISYQLGRREHITINIYNILGEKVETLLDEAKNIGVYSLNWSAQNFASGIYLCVLTFDQGQDIKKMMLIK